eukprot:4080915-Alexandrium_andersonii.AAC.1
MGSAARPPSSTLAAMAAATALASLSSERGLTSRSGRPLGMPWEQVFEAMGSYGKAQVPSRNRQRSRSRR